MKQNNQTTESAKDFAFVTHAARDMAEIMQRTFKVRVKSSSDLSWSIVRGKQAKLLGKWINVKINWTLTNCHILVLDVEGSKDLIQLLPREFHHMTQVGDFPKIVELYKLYQKTFS